jgi:hypothetical protein
MSGQLHVPAALAPRKEPTVSIGAGLDAVKKRNYCTAENRNRSIQPVARRYIDWATPTPSPTLAISTSEFNQGYLRTAVTNKNAVEDEIDRIMHLGMCAITVS